MRVIDIENIVTNMKDDARFVLRCEEVFHDKISSAAASILMNKGQKPIVCLTGPSGSGKTTTAMRLREYLENLGVKVCMLSMDNFFLPLDQRPPEASDWESPYCVNRDLLIEDIHRLMDGELVELPVYDFKAGGVGGYKPMQGDKDAVIIADLGTKGQVISLPDSKGNVGVQAGMMKTRVPLKNLRLDTSPKKPNRSNTRRVSKAPSRAEAKVTTEIDLRGMASDEAILELDRFIDEAVLTGIDQLTIVHGKGTGAVRKAVREHLKRSRYVKSFRPGRYGEGEDGVTIAELR